MDQGPRHSLPKGMCSVEEGVEIGQQGVADVQIMSGGIQQQGVFTEGGGILVPESRPVVIPRERIKCSQLHPSSAQLLSDVLHVTTDVGTYLGRSTHTSTVARERAESTACIPMW